MDRRPADVVTDDERRRIRWLALIVILAVIGLVGWLFDLFVADPVVVGTTLS